MNDLNYIRIPTRVCSQDKVLKLYIFAVPSLEADATLVPVRLKQTSKISSLCPMRVAKLLLVFLISQSLHVLSIDEVTICDPEKLN